MKSENRIETVNRPLNAPFASGRLGLAALLFCIILCQTDSALAVAFRLPNQDPLAIARGNAFVATADNPSAIFYNPAGISQLDGWNVSFGLYLVSAGDTFTSSATGQKADTDKTFQPVPQFYATYHLPDTKWSFGLGVYAPYGLALDWGDTPPFYNVSQNGSLLYATITPIIAYQATPELSLAIGPTLNYSQAQLEQGIGFLPGDKFKFSGNGYDFGFHAGALWKPTEKWAFGINYTYQTTIDYKGHTTTQPSPPLPAQQSTTASLVFPQYFVAGVSFRPTDKWNIEVDIDWTDWSKVNQIVFQGTALGNITFPQNYESSLMYEVGVTRELNNGYHVSAGYFYSENSIPDRYFNPVLPDSALHLISAGVGHKGEHWGWDFSYTIAFSPGRDVSNSIFDTGAPGGFVNGHYETINHALNLAVSYKF